MPGVCHEHEGQVLVRLPHVRGRGQPQGLSGPQVARRDERDTRPPSDDLDESNLVLQLHRHGMLENQPCQRSGTDADARRGEYGRRQLNASSIFTVVARRLPGRDRKSVV